jgi:hypothetical protein
MSVLVLILVDNQVVKFLSSFLSSFERIFLFLRSPVEKSNPENRLNPEFFFGRVLQSFRIFAQNSTWSRTGIIDLKWVNEGVILVRK